MKVAREARAIDRARVVERHVLGAHDAVVHADRDARVGALEPAGTARPSGAKSPRGGRVQQERQERGVVGAVAAEAQHAREVISVEIELLRRAARRDPRAAAARRVAQDACARSRSRASGPRSARCSPRSAAQRAECRAAPARHRAAPPDRRRARGGTTPSRMSVRTRAGKRRRYCCATRVP